MRKKFICGNWKMNKTPAEAAKFLAGFLPLVKGITDVEVGLAVPYTTLAAAVAAAKSAVLIGAQNVHWAEKGAYTGEISAGMLKDAGVAFAIVGHSERRQYFGETDETVGKRALAALNAGLMAIICVGETLEERNGGRELEVVEAQLKGGLAPLGTELMERVVIAYEPVWAIGTGLTATAEEAQRMHLHIRGEVKKMFGEGIAEGVLIQYGGSVTPANAAEILGMADVDGALVGGASLDAETFASVVRFRV